MMCHPVVVTDPFKRIFCSNSGVRQRSGTKSLQRPDSGLLSEFVGRTFDGFHFVIRFGLWRGERFVDGHVCIPAVAVLPITAVEWDLADGQTLVDAWRKGDERSPCLIFARFQGRYFLSFSLHCLVFISYTIKSA